MKDQRSSHVVSHILRPITEHIIAQCHLSSLRNRIILGATDGLFRVRGGGRWAGSGRGMGRGQKAGGQWVVGRRCSRSLSQQQGCSSCSRGEKGEGGRRGLAAAAARGGGAFVDQLGQRVRFLLSHERRCATVAFEVACK